MPAWPSKWAEIYRYDLYVGLGMSEQAEVVLERFTNTVDDFPRAGTQAPLVKCTYSPQVMLPATPCSSSRPADWEDERQAARAEYPDVVY